MARLRKVDPEDAPFTDESRRSGLGAQTTTSKPATRSSPRKKATTTYRERTELSESESDDETKLQPKSTPNPIATGNGKQRRLAPLKSASLSKPLQIQPLLLPASDRATGLDKRKCNTSLFSRKLPSPAKQKKKAPTPTPPESEESGPEDADVEVEVEESVWCGSDASSESDEDELPSPRKFLGFQEKPQAKREIARAGVPDDGLDLARRLDDFNLDDTKAPALEERPEPSLADVPKDSSRPGTSSSKENDAAILRFSPPRLHSPPKNFPDRPVTPPQSPSKSRLQSPSKTKPRVPSPKIRQSLDAFWNAETVNEWNDQYSPRKILKSPKKFQPPAEEPSSPTAAASSPRKAQQSPTKRTKAEREARQAFEDTKHHLAETFLAELDDRITSGRIRALAASTGGVKFIWSKTLNSTAGRANWRRETSKIRTVDATNSKTTVKHHASIELASKVIQSEHRLLNVLAHEYCHLANFMISGIKDQPHGRSFKVWARKVTDAFGERGIEVTTKHSYEIEYKYVWRCRGEECGSEFKRHSKSIDPRRHTCGQCRGGLVQVKPTPRGGRDSGGGGAGNGAGVGGYAAFVKEHFAATKRSLPAGASQKEVMEAVGRKYRAEKAGAQRLGDDGTAGLPDRTGGMDKLAHGIEVIELEDE